MPSSLFFGAFVLLFILITMDYIDVRTSGLIPTNEHVFVAGLQIGGKSHPTQPIK